MIEFLKELPLGISVPYLMFKFTDNIEKYLQSKKQDSFLFRIQDDVDLIVYRLGMISQDIINISFCESSKNTMVKPNVISIPMKESTKISSKLNSSPFSIIINDRKIIDDFYEHVEEDHKNGDQTKLILTLGKDPFKYSDIFFNNIEYGNMFKSLSEDFITAILKEPSLWS